MYKYYPHLGGVLIKQNEEVKDMHNEIFNDIPNFIKNCLRVNFLHGVFVVYNDKVLIRKS